MSQVIVVGGGLSGLSAAHTVLEHGGRVLLLDKSPFMGGNSTKATSGINGALTRSQIKLGIQDSAEAFLADTKKSARGRYRAELGEVLVGQSAPAVEWLIEAFKLDLSLVSRLGGHSNPRTHRGKEKFPGMTITYAMMEKIEDISAKEPHRARVITKATVTKLIYDKDHNTVLGVEYEKGGQTFKEYGPVVIATGGYGYDFGPDSILAKFRPDLLKKELSTTNGEHCTGDGIKMALEIGAETADIDAVQVHPTGLVDPKEPNTKVKFLAAEALRGVGGLLLDRNGNRFVDELQHRDFVTGKMWENAGPFRLVLNGKASKEIEWHCKHYTGRGLMKYYKHGSEIAQDMGIPASKLDATFQQYNKAAETKKDPFGRKYFQNLPYTLNDHFHVAIVTPVIHYCMGGLQVGSHAEVRGKNGAISGLWAAGEVMGGTHGENRLGGSSLLDCVVFGRVAGNSASRYLLDKYVQGHQSVSGATPSTGITIEQGDVKISIRVSSGKAATGSATTLAASASGNVSASSTSSETPAKPAAESGKKDKTFTATEVAKHAKDTDCWVIINGQVLDVTHFLKDHPGGKKAIMLYAGRDATEEFNMLHKPDVIAKYAPETVIGKVSGAAKSKL